MACAIDQALGRVGELCGVPRRVGPAGGLGEGNGAIAEARRRIQAPEPRMRQLGLLEVCGVERCDARLGADGVGVERPACGAIVWRLTAERKADAADIPVHAQVGARVRIVGVGAGGDVDFRVRPTCEPGTVCLVSENVCGRVPVPVPVLGVGDPADVVVWVDRDGDGFPVSLVLVVAWG